jgi:hypothetical protein
LCVLLFLYTCSLSKTGVFNSFTVFQRIPGITVDKAASWRKIRPRQREAIKLQVQGFIEQLANIPNPTGGIRSLIPSGEVIHDRLHHRGPFGSTASFLKAYENENVPFIHRINSRSKPVFSHLDWDLSNVVLHPNLDAVAGVVDWELASFFPEGGKSIHRMCYQGEGWGTLFDGMQFPREDMIPSLVRDIGETYMP